MKTLKRNVRQHGVIVPLTLYRQKGQAKYSILDGERRYGCVKELANEGGRFPYLPMLSHPPPVSGLLYMFSAQCSQPTISENNGKSNANCVGIESCDGA